MGAPKRSELALQTQLRLVEDLQTARSRFDAVARRAGSTWLAVDDAGLIEYISPGWLKLSRKPATELLGADWRAAFVDAPLEAGRLLPVNARERGQACRALRVDVGAVGWLLELSPLAGADVQGSQVDGRDALGSQASTRASDERWNWRTGARRTARSSRSRATRGSPASAASCAARASTRLRN